MSIRRLVCLAALALAGCEGAHDLARDACLPLTVPTQVVLQQSAGLYAIRDEPALSLQTLPVDTTNHAFNRVRLVRTLAPGAQLRVVTLDQTWGFDSGLGPIRAHGTTDDGAAFVYHWGVYDQIQRAPWESTSTPARRAVTCAR